MSDAGKQPISEVSEKLRGNLFGDFWRSGLLAVAYVAMAHMSEAFALRGLGIPLFAPQVGLSLVALILGGLRLWPGVFVGAVFGGFLFEHDWRFFLPVAIGATFGSVAAVYVLRRRFFFQRDFDEPAHLAGFLIVAVGVVAPVFALMQMLGLLWSGNLVGVPLAEASIAAWGGAFVGALIVTPMIIAASRLALEHRDWVAIGELTFLLGVLAAVSFAVFFEDSGFSALGTPLAFLMFPLLILISWRFGISGASMASFVIGVACVVGTLRTGSRFPAGDFDQGLARYLIFISATSITALVLASFHMQRDQALRALRRSEWQLEEAQRIGQFGVWVWDPKAKRLSMSAGFCRLFQLRETSARSLEPFFRSVLVEDRPVLEAAVESAITTRGPSSVECRVRLSGEQVRHFAVTVTALGSHGRSEDVLVLGTVLDVTERKIFERDQAHLQGRLVEAQKRESLGVLAGGIAHDFNNLLTGIMGNAALARGQLSADSPVVARLERIEKASERAGDLCRQMLAYSGKSRLVVRPICINTTVRSSWPLFATSVGAGNTLVLEAAEELPQVLADAAQVQQVLVNLVMNAAEALPESGGRVIIRTGVMTADAEWFKSAYLAPELSAGSYVYFSVEDNGRGMAQDVVQRIFDPFFSTKFKGRGLGLAAVAGIVRSHGGAVRVASHPGQGTKMWVCLPSAPQVLPEAGDAVRERGSPVLVIDDERDVRDVVCGMLEAVGFESKSAPDGLAGLEVLAEMEKLPCAVLLDLTMPRLDGLETLRRIRSVHAILPVVVMSGHPYSDTASQFSGLGVSGFLQKPFSADALRETLGRATS